MSDLSEKRCVPCEGGTLPLSEEEMVVQLRNLPKWQVSANGMKSISRTFEFKNYYQTMAFVNAVAWIAHQEDHHPDLRVGYRQCLVQYTTHAIQGLSLNDFICAAKVEKLIS